MLWELFSLGKVPYTGMDANQELFYKRRDGYRMEKPKYCTQDIYDIMLNCWNAKPESRPVFNELERKLSSFMMDSVKDVRIFMAFMSKVCSNSFKLFFFLSTALFRLKRTIYASKYG